MEQKCPSAAQVLHMFQHTAFGGRCFIETSERNLVPHSLIHVWLADDEWVRVMGEAVGSFDGQLNLRSVCESSGLVRDTVAGLEAGLAHARPPTGFMPLQVR